MLKPAPILDVEEHLYSHIVFISTLHRLGLWFPEWIAVNAEDFHARNSNGVDFIHIRDSMGIVGCAEVIEDVFCSLVQSDEEALSLFPGEDVRVLPSWTACDVGRDLGSRVVGENPLESLSERETPVVECEVPLNPG